MTETEGQTGSAETREEVLIATPTADGLLTTGYAESLVNAIGAIQLSGRKHAFMSFDFHDVAIARTHLAAVALARPNCSHVLFLDRDMAVSATLFRRLFEVGRPVAGAVYTKRQIDLETYAKARIEGHTPELARALASAFVVRLSPGQLRVEKGFAPVDGLGLGATLIETAFLRRMARTGKIAEIAPVAQIGLAEGAKIHDFFARVTSDGGERLSEDFAFCLRANAIEPGSVWGYLGEGALHQGKFDYGAALIERLKKSTADAGQGGAQPGTTTTQ